MGFLDWCSRAGGRIYDAAGSAVSAVGSGLEAVGNGVVATAKGAGTLVSAAWDEESRAEVAAAYKTVKENVIDPVGGALGTAYDAVTDGENWKAIGNGIVEYGEFVITEPGLAARQLGQGLSDSVVSMGGLAVDAVWYTADNLIYKGVIQNGSRALYNLGAAEEDMAEYKSMDKFFRATEFFEEHTNDWLGYTREQLEEMVEKGELDERFLNDALYTKYAGQAVGEVATFIAVGAATAGTGAAALAMARGSALATRTGLAVANLGRVGEVVAKPLLWAGKNVAATRGLPYLQRGLSGVDDVARLGRAEGMLGMAQRGLIRGTVATPRLIGSGVNLTGSVANRFLPGFVANSRFAGHLKGSIGYGLEVAENTARWFAPWDPRFGGKLAIAMETGGAGLSFYGAYAKELRRAEEGAQADALRDSTVQEADERSADAIREALRQQDAEGGGGDSEPVPGTVDGRTQNIQPQFELQGGQPGDNRAREFNLRGDGTTTTTPLRIIITPGGEAPDATNTPGMGNDN